MRVILSLLLVSSYFFSTLVDSLENKIESYKERFLWKTMFTSVALKGNGSIIVGLHYSYRLDHVLEQI